MIFQITVLIAMLVGPTSPPVLNQFLIPIPFMSMGSCEEVRTSGDFIEANTKARAVLLEKYKDSSVSIASKCVDTSMPKRPKYEAL